MLLRQKQRRNQRILGDTVKDISKISKSFYCDCGTQNKFEFETDLDIHNITISAQCQSCGKENSISLESFFRKNGSPTTSTINLSEALPEVNVNELIESGSESGSGSSSDSSESSSSGSSSSENVENLEEEVGVTSEMSSEEDLTSEEKEAFSDLFGNL